MYHPIVKEQVIPGQLEGLQTNRHNTEAPSKCQALIPTLNSAFLHQPLPVEIPSPVDLKAIKKRGYTQTDLRKRLDEPQPRISDLMTGKMSKFSLETLLSYADALGLRPQILVEAR